MASTTQASTLIRRLDLPTGIFIVVAGFRLLRPDLFDANPLVSRADAPRWIPYVLESALWISGALALHRWLSLLVLEGVVTRALGRPLPRIFQDLLGVVLMTGATVGVLVSVFDQSMSGFWAASGAIGVVLGLALRPIILDFFSGPGINLEHAYSIGDYVSISTNRGEPIKGWIEEIQWRTLRIRTRDGFIVIVPNSELATSAVTNYALPRPESRFHLEVRLDVDVPTDRALRILRSAAHEATGLPDGPQRSPAPDVLIWSAGDSGVLYRIRFWLDPARLSSDTATHVVWICVLQQLAKAGLSLAQPRETVFLARLPRDASGVHSVEDRVAFLRRVALFERFPDASLRWLATETVLRLIRPGQVLVRAGDPGDSMFLIAEGCVRVMSAPSGDTAPIELATLQAGQVVGERSLLTGEPRSASVHAVTECLVLEITRTSLSLLIEREPDLLRHLEETVSAREQMNADRIAASQTPGSTETPESRTQALLRRMRELFRPSSR